MIKSFLRMSLIQAAWNHERMLGTGMAYAAMPLLARLGLDPEEYRQALARQSEYFNAQPYLAGMALGATVKAEADGVPGPRIQRLRTALGGTLGALGDQIFWAGLLPGLVVPAAAMAVLGAPLVAVAGFVVVFNCLRLAIGLWALKTGLAQGTAVSSALANSWMPRSVGWVGAFAGLAVGFGLPLVAVGLAEPLAGVGVLWLIGLALVVAWTGRKDARLQARRLTMALAALVILWHLVVS